MRLQSSLFHYMPEPDKTGESLSATAVFSRELSPVLVVRRERGGGLMN